MRFFLIIVITLVIDQLSKYFVQANMLCGESIPILSPVFYLTYIQNPGAAFGILAHQTLFFVVVTLIVIGIIFYIYQFVVKRNEYMYIALGLLTGGAIGNLIDRLRIGRVVDFLDFRIWPVFNLADTAIVLGAGILVYYVWKHGEKKEKINEDAEG